MSASFNAFLLRKVSKAKGQTACSLSSGLTVQVEFVFVACFEFCFYWLKKCLRSSRALWTQLLCPSVPLYLEREECMLFCAMEVPVCFQRLKLWEMCKTFKCQNISRSTLNFLLVQISNGRFALICKIIISHCLLHVNTDRFFLWIDSSPSPLLQEIFNSTWKMWLTLKGQILVYHSAFIILLLREHNIFALSPVQICFFVYI